MNAARLLVLLMLCLALVMAAKVNQGVKISKASKGSRTRNIRNRKWIRRRNARRRNKPRRAVNRIKKEGVTIRDKQTPTFRPQPMPKLEPVLIHVVKLPVVTDPAMITTTGERPAPAAGISETTVSAPSPKPFQPTAPSNLPRDDLVVENEYFHRSSSPPSRGFSFLASLLIVTFNLFF